MIADDPIERFRRLFAAVERDLLAYALRRVEPAEDAADVVAETFLVAWRRLDDVPAGDEARPWLYGVARRQIANQRRGQLRRSRLADRLRGELPAALAGVGAPDDEHAAALRVALGRLSSTTASCSCSRAGRGWRPRRSVALAISGVTVRSRLHRARGRLRTELLREDAVLASASATLATKAAR